MNLRPGPVIYGSTIPYLQVRRHAVYRSLIGLSVAGSSEVFARAETGQGVEYSLTSFDLDIVGIRAGEKPRRWTPKRVCFCGVGPAELARSAEGLALGLDGATSSRRAIKERKLTKQVERQDEGTRRAYALPP